MTVSQLISSLLVLPPPPPHHPSSFHHPPPPPPRNFADKVVRLGKNGEEWKVAGRGKSVKKPAIKGTNNESGLKGVPPQSKIWYQFSVTRLDVTTSQDDVRRHLHQSGIEVKEIWLLNSQLKGTKTAKVRVSIEHRERAKNPALWPLYSRISDWDFSRPRKGKVEGAAATVADRS